MLSGFLSAQRGSSSGCGRRRRHKDVDDSVELPEMEIGKPDSGWSCSFGVGREARNFSR
jgi:hypothetical protein